MHDKIKDKIYIRRDASFNETDFEHSNKAQLEIDNHNDEYLEEKSNKKSSDIRCSTRERKPLVYYHDEYARVATAKHTALLEREVEEPTKLNKTLDSDHALNWKEAADLEYQFLMENMTWKLVESYWKEKQIPGSGYLKSNIMKKDARMISFSSSESSLMKHFHLSFALHLSKLFRSLLSLKICFPIK